MKRSGAVLRKRPYDIAYPATSVAAIQVVQVVRCTRAHDTWGPTSEDQIAI